MKKKHSTKRIPDEKREMVKVLAVQGLSERDIAGILNISKTQVNTIKKQTNGLDQMRADKKRKMAEEIWDLAIRMYDHITDEKLRKTSAAKLTIAMATAIDKSLLLAGDATERVEVKTEAELEKEWKELDKAEKELKEAWKRAEEKRKKAAEELGGDNNED